MHRTRVLGIGSKRLNVRERLQGGDRRELGNADAVASDVLRYPERFAELFEAIMDADPVIRMRAADAAEKVTRGRPDLLVPFRKRLIDEAGTIAQQEVRRRVAQMLPRVKLNAKERAKAVALLESFLQDRSAIVVTSALQSLTDFANDDAILRERMILRLERLVSEGEPAIQERSRKMLARLSSQHAKRRPLKKNW